MIDRPVAEIKITRTRNAFALYIEFTVVRYSPSPGSKESGSMLCVYEYFNSLEYDGQPLRRLISVVSHLEEEKGKT